LTEEFPSPFSAADWSIAMRTSRLRFSIIAGCVACALAAVEAAEPRTFQTANIFLFGYPAALMPGAATLYRSRGALEMRIAASNLPFQSSNTVWWFVFNNPSACVDGCGVDDLSRPAVRASVVYAAGFVTGVTDMTNVTARLKAGALPSNLDVEQGAGLEPGNGLGAEVHLVIRTHGGTVPGLVNQQISSFNGGCNAACEYILEAVFPAMGRR
jgi:hypothetical protein